MNVTVENVCVMDLGVLFAWIINNRKKVVGAIYIPCLTVVFVVNSVAVAVAVYIGLDCAYAILVVSALVNVVVFVFNDN